ncbi:N-acetylmannosaminyltransferase [Rubellimicrobium mesophilum DSM 19309]|uniref:N-acetylmannosaminyltransferase n=1 Tax=Rubellimicrobium mesophilum DSM 19309 TaxID=442562 RepID=A0A017HKT8_9RHOB|nr:WecB/TagA/CpsF family glycosyltransferase [Rubellimicrobium mesophilum]EYD74940.1 N-acetylmannosaminyltransferase [Rubellimicrobium mesophilum DSM 19309]
MTLGGKGGAKLKQRRLGGLAVTVAGTEDLLELMASDVGENRTGRLGRPRVVTDINGEAVSLYARSEDYRAAYDRADVWHADGAFIVALSRLLPGPTIPERTATTDYIHAAAKAAQDDGISFYLLGGPEDINSACAAELIRRYPRLRIAGRHHGYFRDDELDAIAADINSSGADVVWLGLGKPRETMTAVLLRDRLDCAWIVTCGGCFHFVAGDYKRAPIWMQKAGLEWLHRMLTGPRYLIKRYAVTIPHALYLVLRSALFEAPRQSGP